MNDNPEETKTESVGIKKEDIIFLGLADHSREQGAPYPAGGVDLFQLATHKQHIVYPGMIGGNFCVLLVRSSALLNNFDFTKWIIKIVNHKDEEVLTTNFLQADIVEVKPGETKLSDIKPTENSMGAFLSAEFTLLRLSMVGAVASEPGEYLVQSIYDGTSTVIGKINFLYAKTPPFSLDQIKALESDPGNKVIKLELGCKHCPKKLVVYTARKRASKVEDEGARWYADLEDRFECECGKTSYSLQYLRESMHGMLLKHFDLDTANLSYERLQGHQQNADIVRDFRKLITDERLEPPVQKFIEEHPALLARFHPKRIFVKPNIIGKFQTDFMVLDSNKHLWFIEIERPSISLFKRRDGHPTADLMHAYEQVKDWLGKYAQYPGAVLETLKLKPEDVVAVRGMVIAGRNEGLLHEVLQRHLSSPPYANIDFMTFDDLATSLLEISKKLS